MNDMPQWAKNNVNMCQIFLSDSQFPQAMLSDVVADVDIPTNKTATNCV